MFVAPYSPAMYALRNTARVVAVAASLIFGYLAINQGPPVPPDGPGFERDLQYGFLILGILATLLAWWSPAGGGALMLVTGIVLGVLAAMRYSEQTALGVALLYVIPATLFLAVWALRRPIFVQALTLAVIVVLMAYGGTQAQARHARSFGPAHPASVMKATPYKDVEWVWSGGVTSTSAVVNARVTVDGTTTRLIARDTRTPGNGRTVTSAAATPNDDGVVSLSLQGLEPGTTYAYAVEVNGVSDDLRGGKFTTFPQGAASFTIAVGSCARTGSNGAVFDAIREANPLLYIVPGDFHYENIDTADYSGFRRAFQKSLTAPSQLALHRETPIAYVWDDHDFGGNNSDANSPARETAQEIYDTYVPHYDLPAGDGAIYQAFTIGRVRFVMTDTRSERNAERRPDGSQGLLGSEQLQWFKNELATASQTHALVVWVSAVPWIGDFSDSWGGFKSERAEIANFIADQGIDNLVMLAGDAHMVAIDDGTNADYSDSGKAGFPVLHAAALDRPGSIKGGPYSEGAFPGAGQFGLMEVQDDGQTVIVRLSGYTWEGTELVSYSFTVPAGVAEAP